ARDLQTQHEADTGERHLGSEPGIARAGRGSATRQAQVFINDDDPFGGPAELTSLAGERVLPFSRFAIVLDLSGAGLTQIDDSMGREMARRDFAALIPDRHIFCSSGQVNGSEPPECDPRQRDRAVAPALAAKGWRR